MDASIPTFGEGGRSGVKSIVSSVIERDGLEAVFAFLHI
jgi:hypothetical protein